MCVWNKDKRVGQKKAFKLEDIWRIRIRLELEERLCGVENHCQTTENPARSTHRKHTKTQQTLSQWIIQNALDDCVLFWGR